MSPGLMRRNWMPCKLGLFFKSYCFFETIVSLFKNYQLNNNFNIGSSSGFSDSDNVYSDRIS